MKRSRFFYYLLNIVCGIASVFMLCFGALVGWVATGPRSLDALTPYIESGLVSQTGGYKVKIGSSLLIWDGVLHPVAIRIQNVDILDSKGVSLAHFPEVGLQVYVFELLVGRLDVKSVELLGPVARLTQDEKGNITSFGFSDTRGGPDASIPTALALLTSDSNDNPIARLRSFVVRNASLSVQDAKGNAFLSSPSASIEITRKHALATGKLRMPLQFGETRGDIDISFTIDGNKRKVDSSVIFSEIPSGILHALAPTQQWMDGVHAPLSGWADIKSDFSTEINSIDFLLDIGQGIIDFPDQFEKPLNLSHAKFTGELTENLTALAVKEAQLDFGTHSVAFAGTVRRQGDEFGVDGNAVTANIPIDDIHYYWPLKLAPHSRHWVVSRLKGGTVIKAGTALHFKPGEFKLKDTPEADVDASITVQGTAVQYKPGHPPITDASGVVRFTGRTMDARITSAKYLNGTHVKAARARFPDFYPDDVRMLIEADLETTAKDVQRFLALPDLNKSAKLNLTPEITGTAKGSAKLDFIAFSENDKDDVGATGKLGYAIEGELVNVSQKRFLGSRDVENADMKISLDNKGIKASGKAKVNGVPMGISLAAGFGKDNETSYAVRTEMPIARMPDFNLPALDFATGSIGVDATFLTSDTTEKVSAMLDLTRADIKLPEHGFVKSAGKKATLKLSTERLPSGDTRVSAFTYKEDGQTAAGEAEFDRKSQDFSRLSFSPLRIGKHDLDSLAYEKSGSTVNLTAKGRAFDASPYLDSKGRNPDIGYAVDLRADKMILGENREISDVAVEADCPAEECRAVRINAKLKDGSPFLYTIAGGKLEASCGNAGELARVMAVFDTIEGGVMSMKGEYKDGKLQGMLEVDKYTLKNAPVLTKIFTIASLTGFLDTLVGNGIYFNKLSAPFVYHHGLIVLKGARAHGSALGFTADGMIDTNKNTLDLTGVLVPSYTINSLVGNIPLIGDLINGGKGKGLVALNYGLHGDIKDPSVSVNPLSVFTPGFLRDIFDIFDKPQPDIDAIEKTQKTAPTQDGKGQGAAAPAAVQPPAAGNAAPLTVPVPPAGSSLPSVDELRK